METISSDPGKPSPQNVLSALSNKVEFENKLLELCNMDDSSSCTPDETNRMFSQSMKDSSDGRNVVDSGHANLENESSKHLQSSNKMRLLISHDSPCHHTAEDLEALRLLNWLASSQAAEDINSDDELRRETILSPLMPATTINQVLEKADMEYLSASQQECQDILDSVQDSTNVECRTKSKIVDCNSPPQLSSKKDIPQVDGSGDGKKPIYNDGNLVDTEKNKERAQLDSSSSFSKKHKRKRPLWGSLPFCLSENANASQPTDVKVGRCDTEINIGTGNCAVSTIVGCSVRDLMRRKRYHRGESPKVEIHHDAKVEPEESNNNIICSPEQSSDKKDISPPASSNSKCCVSGNQQEMSPTSSNEAYGPPAVSSSPLVTFGFCYPEDRDKAENIGLKLAPWLLS